MSVQISVSEEFAKLVDQIAKKKGYEKKADAVQYIGQVFLSRYKAVTRYAEKGGAPKRASKKKVAKKTAAKKPAKKRTPKAAPAAGNAEATAAV